MKTLGALLLLCLAAWSQAVFGHAVLVAAEPAAGTVLDHAPATMWLEFSEPVGISALSLLGPDGKPLTLGPAQSEGSRVRITLPPAAAPGTYLLTWRASSADGHPVGGTLDFAVGAPTAAAASPLGTAQAWRDVAIWAGRLLAFVCLLAACGAAVFRATAPPTREDWARRAIRIGLAALFIDLALQGLDLLDAPWSALTEADTWRAALATPYAGTLGFAALALAAAYRAQDTDRTLILRLSAAGSLILLGLAVANSGHAGTAPPQWLSRPAIALHVMAAAAWLGALVPLARRLHRHLAAAGVQGPADRPNTAAASAGPVTLARLPALSRFSRWISSAVAILALSGLTLALLQLDQPADLWQTSYGQVLSAKLALVFVLLALAADNRWRLTAPALAGDIRAARRLAHAIRAEIVLAILILGIVSLWRFTPPPRSLDAVAPASAHMTSGADSPLALTNDQVFAWIRRAADGTEWTIELATLQGRPLAAQALTITLDNPNAGLEPLRREARRLPDGAWRVQLPALPDMGLWQLNLDILVDDFNRVTLRAALAL
ncbi:CopD family protein [Castellaniella sp. GW247-6E4]|uniref:copper resistance CopC/CopD family protein n=1 Tax=Castellaniella sp. GW247-6E4 TaxID=3140380 RepID=UPI0033159F1C